MMTKIKKFKNWIVALIFGSAALAAPFVIPNNSFENLDNVQKISDKYEIDLGEGSKIKLGGSGVDFKPHAKLGKWDDEVEINVWLETDKKIKPKQDKEKLKWKDNKREVHFYIMDNNKFEFEIILNEKPDSNIVELKIESKGLDFYYQPELTQEEKDLGASRPENVIGSYAVYHESKKGDYSQLGLKNYRAGKAFHIFRPRIVDSAGNEVWGVLNIDIENNLLTVEIPWLFLNNAVYPVRHAAGLTFGHDPESFGGSSLTIAADGGDSCYYIGTKYTLSEAGTPTALTFYISAVNVPPDIDAKAAIHSSDGSSKEEESVSSGVSSTGWKERSIAGASELAAADYVLGVIGDGNDAGAFKSLKVAYDSGDANTACYESQGSTYAVPATVDVDNNYEISIYATYTVGAEEERRIIKIE